MDVVVRSTDVLSALDSSTHGAPGAVLLERPSTPLAETVRNIVFVTSEVAPWSKTGGLGDVAGSLPFALAARGHRVMVVAPRYAEYPEAFDSNCRVTCLGTEVGFFVHQSRGVDFVFVDHPSYPRPGGIYADAHGAYGDNQFRFALLCLAALEAPLHLDLARSVASGSGNGASHPLATETSRYGQDCVFVANDWHAALVPVYIAAKYRKHGTYMNARTVIAIHNLKHQGVFPPYSFPDLGLPGDWYGALEYQYPPHQRQGSYEEEGRSVNHFKAGLSTADRVVTVSSGYAEEIKTYLGGWGMDDLLASRDSVLNGITNGIDTDEWDPASDPHLPVNYDASSFRAGKAACKAALQAELGLPVDAAIPLIAFIGRLDPQKGADILLEAAPGILSQNNVQLVCLGSGSKDLEDGLRWLEGAYPTQARGWVGFNVPFSHKLTAAADILVMPSRFEPCGLNQLYAMRYGTVPVAHKTGGLKDTVIDFNPWKKEGTGWTYTSCDQGGLKHAVGMALLTLKNHPEDFEALQLRGMHRNASWDEAAQRYEQVFTWAVTDAPYCK
ncbi:MAG: hypothetical protein WDW36_010136 [Sanguina aurantia]